MSDRQLLVVALLPLLRAGGSGAEIVKRVAAPMIGGLLTSAFITLEVVPVLYTIWRCRQLGIAQRTGVPLEKITGATPVWALNQRENDEPHLPPGAEHTPAFQQSSMQRCGKGSHASRASNSGSSYACHA